jgi:2-iminobutanoate/2-iminopropanoate deaminase
MDGDAMDIRRINPATMATPGGHYSHSTVAAGLVFVSGQFAITPAGEKLHQASFEIQARQVLANVQAALEAAGSSVTRLAQVRVYVTDIGDWPAFDRLYAQWADSPPCSRCVVPVPRLHYGFAIEMEAIGLAGPQGQ